MNENTIVFSCPNCHSEYRADEKLLPIDMETLKYVVYCPNCENLILINPPPEKNN